MESGWGSRRVSPGTMERMRAKVLAALAAVVLAGCAAQRPAMTAAEGRSLIAAYLQNVWER